ncbi:Gfo/Idh/MocA family protein [Paenibacillus bovis]|uniref:Oxidoreductase n=1 Tax=Paenibacillus bovis TaxID=1616788 RepID=A0A172ZKA9_9BACL|nr:Gfo/Idh/MocA family oxidoreductase [Paenibacillus bovis]ANF98081.1 oxidoreductase [Paenibacillus bovis]
MTTLNWAIVGTGEIAHDFADAIRQVNGRVFAVCSRQMDRSRQFASECGAEHAYDNIDEMLRNPAIDIVYIATPHSNHRSYVIKCLHADKHVFCEKAITVNSEELQEIQALAKEKNRILAEAMTIYHMPLYQKLHTILDSGRLGALQMINVSMGDPKEYDPENRFYNPELAGGALLDMGVYALSFVRCFLSGPLDQILTSVHKAATGVDEQSATILQTRRNEMANVSLSLNTSIPRTGIIGCEKGYIEIREFSRADQAVIHYTDGQTETIQAGSTDQALAYEVEYMNRCVQGEQPEHTMDLTTDVMELMTRIREKWKMHYPFEKITSSKPEESI